MGEGCVTAIEALNVLYDEKLIENSAAMGARLLAGLQALQQQHPRLIKEVRGMGLMIGIEFADLSATRCRSACGRWSRCSTTSSKAACAASSAA